MSRIKGLTLADLGRKSVRRSAPVSDLLQALPEPFEERDILAGATKEL